MHSQGNLPQNQASINDNPLPYFMAMIESIDFQIGEIKAAMTPEDFDNTTIVILGDNGSPGSVAQAPFNGRAKGNLHQGGVNTPMIVSGKSVTRQNARESALINSTDLFTTFLNIAGSNITEMNNSKSFEHLLTGSAGENREFVYAEVSGTNNSGYTIRNEQYKLIVNEGSPNFFYDLLADPEEATNLLSGGGLTDEQQAARSALAAEANAIRQ